MGAETGPAVFLHEDGTPMIFYMINVHNNPKYVDDRARIQALVESNGGRWMPPRDAKEKGVLHRLVRPEDKDAWQKRLSPDQVLYLTTYVKTCVSHSKLVPLAPFTVKACEARPKRHHSYFSEEDDAALVEYALKANSSLMGNRFWTKVADEWGRGHTWQSVKNRFKKHLLPALKAGKKFKTADLSEENRTLIDTNGNRKGRGHGPLKDDLSTNVAELPLQGASTVMIMEPEVPKQRLAESAAIANREQGRTVVVGEKPKKLSARHLSEGLAVEKSYGHDEATGQENKALLYTKNELAGGIGEKVKLEQVDEIVLEGAPAGPGVLHDFGESSVSADEAPLGKIGQGHAREFENVLKLKQVQSSDCIVGQYRSRRKETCSVVQMQADVIVEETLGQNALQVEDDGCEERAAEIKLTERQLTRIEQVRQGVRSLKIRTGSAEDEVVKALVMSSGNFIVAELLLKKWKAGSMNETVPVWSSEEDAILLRYSTSGRRDNVEDVSKLREAKGEADVEARIFFLTGGLQEHGEE